MKKLVVNAALYGLLASSFAAHAALEDLGNGIIADTDLGIKWLADANYSKTSGYNTNGVMNWNAANTWVNQLNVGGHSDWKLPTTDQMKHLFYNELDGVVDNSIYKTHNNANFDLFKNIQAQVNGLGVVEASNLYWTSTPTDDNSKASVFAFFNGRDYAYDKNEGRFAMAVSSVPEPETYAMLLAGLGLLGWRLRNAKS